MTYVFDVILTTFVRRLRINDLPNEIMEEIFLIFATMAPPLLGSGEYEHAGWTSLLCVCRAWYLLIMQCSPFWAAVHHHNPSTMSKALVRSGTMGVQYVLTDDSCTGLWPLSVWTLQGEVAWRALQEFKPSRCLRIKVSARGDVQGHLMKILEDCDGSDLPMLKELLLSWGRDVPPNFFVYACVCNCFMYLGMLLMLEPKAPHSRHGRPHYRSFKCSKGVTIRSPCVRAKSLLIQAAHRVVWDVYHESFSGNCLDDTSSEWYDTVLACAASYAAGYLSRVG